MGQRRRRHTPEQIIRKLREADRLLGEGQEVGQVAKQLEVSEQTLNCSHCAGGTYDTGLPDRGRLNRNFCTLAETSARPRRTGRPERPSPLIGHALPSSVMSGTSEPWTGIGPAQRPFRDAAWFYAEYRYRPSEVFVRRLAAHLGWSSSDRVLDLGAGPARLVA